MNRKPQPADSWWSTHQNSCNGTFEKISGPDSKMNFKVKAKPEIVIKSDSRTNNIKTDTKIESQPFKGKGRTWSEFNFLEPPLVCMKAKVSNFFAKNHSKSLLMCINCSNFKTDSLKDLNEHLDICLQKVFINLAEDLHST